MRQKRQKKTKKYDNDDNYQLFDPKQKKIKKNQSNKKKIKDKNSQIQQEDNAEQQIDKKDEPKMQIQNVQHHNQNQTLKDQSEMKHMKQRQAHSIPQSKLISLAKLNENYQQIKAIHEQNLSKYNFHKKQCQQLSQKVNESNFNIEAKAKELRELSKTIYVESVRNNRAQFLNPNTFMDSQKLESFIKNLISIVDNLQCCPYEDPLENIKFIKIHPESFIIHKQITIGKHKKQKVIKDHFALFPYLTVGFELAQVIQALLASSKYVQKQQGCPIQQFPCLFIRSSGISFSAIQKILNVIYKLTIDKKIKLIKKIQSLVHQICLLAVDVSFQTISELVYKGITQTKFISFPQIQFQIRGFSFGGSIFINTYYIEKDQSISKDVHTSYCVLTLIRQLANFVVNSLTLCLNKSEEDIGKSISDIRQRVDAGAKFEKILTNGHSFTCASAEDYKNMISHDVIVEHLGNHNNQYGTSYVFEEQRKRNNQMRTSLISKYYTIKNPEIKMQSQQNANGKHQDMSNQEQKVVFEQNEQRKQIIEYINSEGDQEKQIINPINDN